MSHTAKFSFVLDPSVPITTSPRSRARLAPVSSVSRPNAAATPRPIVDQLNKWFNEIEATEETRKFLNSFGGDPWITTPEEGQAQLAKDQKDWESYIKAAKIEPQG